MSASGEVDVLPHRLNRGSQTGLALSHQVVDLGERGRPQCGGAAKAHRITEALDVMVANVVLARFDHHIAVVVTALDLACARVELGVMEPPGAVAGEGFG